MAIGERFEERFDTEVGGFVILVHQSIRAGGEIAGGFDLSTSGLAGANGCGKCSWTTATVVVASPRKMARESRTSFRPSPAQAARDGTRVPLNSQ